MCHCLIFAFVTGIHAFRLRIVVLIIVIIVISDSCLILHLLLHCCKFFRGRFCHLG